MIVPQITAWFFRWRHYCRYASSFNYGCFLRNDGYRHFLHSASSPGAIERPWNLRTIECGPSMRIRREHGLVMMIAAFFCISRIVSTNNGSDDAQCQFAHAKEANGNRSIGWQQTSRGSRSKRDPVILGSATRLNRRKLCVAIRLVQEQQASLRSSRRGETRSVGFGNRLS